MLGPRPNHKLYVGVISFIIAIHTSPNPATHFQFAFVHGLKWSHRVTGVVMCQQTVKPTKYSHLVQVTYAEAFHRRPRLVLKCHFGTHLTAFFGLRVIIK